MKCYYLKEFMGLPGGRHVEMDAVAVLMSRVDVPHQCAAPMCHDDDSVVLRHVSRSPLV